MKTGGVSPSRITLRLLKQEIESSDKKRFIIDGFPRSEENNNAWNLNVCLQIKLYDLTLLNLNFDLDVKHCKSSVCFIY